MPNLKTAEFKFNESSCYFQNKLENPVLESLLVVDKCGDFELQQYIVDMDSIKTTTTTTSSQVNISGSSSASGDTTTSPVTTASNRLRELKFYQDFFDLSNEKWSFQQRLDCELEASTESTDYFEMLAEADSPSLTFETHGVGNALFLAVARSILYKLYFVDKRYKFMLKFVYANCLNRTGGDSGEIEFDSDMKLQELLRRNLCLYWLGFVHNGEFKADCKYSKHFENACDFMYQAYQLSVNNFSNNRLLQIFAIEDLAELLCIRIVAFEKMASTDETRAVVYEPSECRLNNKSILNDSVYLSINQAEKIKYKWLLPCKLRPFVDQALLYDEKTATAELNFYKLDASYTKYRILLTPENLHERFDLDFVNTSVNYALYLKFLAECSVHTLISLNELKFEALIRARNPTQMINYLNQLWGQTHFSLKEILNKTQFNNELERIQIENKNFIHEVSKYKQASTQQQSIDNMENANKNNLRQSSNKPDNRIKTEDVNKKLIPIQPTYSTLPIDYSLKKTPSNHFSGFITQPEPVPTNNKRKSTISESSRTCKSLDSAEFFRARPISEATTATTTNQRNFSKSCPEIGTNQCSFFLDNCLTNLYNFPNVLNDSDASFSKSLNSQNEENYLTTTTKRKKSMTTIDQKRSLTWCLDSLLKQSILFNSNEISAESISQNKIQD